MVVPRLEDIARRLELSRHEASVADLLAEPTPLVRFEMRPWRGPLSDDTSLTSGSLDLALVGGPDDEVVARTRLVWDSEETTEDVRISAARLTASWLERVVLDLVEQVLTHA